MTSPNNFLAHFNLPSLKYIFVQVQMRTAIVHLLLSIFVIATLNNNLHSPARDTIKTSPTQIAEGGIGGSGVIATDKDITT